jgi:NADH-quinone oxidoreductase subunit M
MVVLTAFLTPMCLLASWTSITHRIKEFMVAFLVMEASLIGTFSALDFILFFLFYETTLLPMFFLIGIWGGKNRIYAAFKFYLYSMTGSLFLLLAILVLYFEVGSFEIPTLMQQHVSPSLQNWLWLAMFVSFAIKMPLWPVHTWLPDAHIEAPTAGSMILAGALMKVGVYGFLRFLLPILPDACDSLTPIVFTLSVITIIYNSWIAFVQTNIKKLLAYATAAHMGVTAIGVFARNIQGIEGTIVQIVTQGTLSAALFFAAGCLYERKGSYEISKFGGLINEMPRYAVVTMILLLGAVSLPGTGTFVGEMLILVGAFQKSPWVAVLAAVVIVLGPLYMLRFYHRSMFGVLSADTGQRGWDLNRRELFAFVPMVAVVLWLGINPGSLTTRASVSVADLVEPQTTKVASVAPISSSENTLLSQSIQAEAVPSGPLR